MAAYSTDLPLNQDISTRFFPWIMGMMVYVAGLAFLCAFGFSVYVNGLLPSHVTQRITLEVPVSDPEQAPHLAEKIQSILQKNPDILDIHVVSAQEMKKAISPWLTPGKEEHIFQQAPLPVLVDVLFKENAAVDHTEFLKNIQDISGSISVISYPEKTGTLTQWVHAAQTIAVFCASLFLVAMVCVVIFTVRSSIAIHGPIMEILYLMGATPGYIVRQFLRQAIKNTVKACLYATILMAGTLLFLTFTLEGFSFPTIFTVDKWPLLSLLMGAFFLMVWVLILLTTWRTVTWALKRGAF